MKTNIYHAHAIIFQDWQWIYSRKDSNSTFFYKVEINFTIDTHYFHEKDKVKIIILERIEHDKYVVYALYKINKIEVIICYILNYKMDTYPHKYVWLNNNIDR